MGRKLQGKRKPRTLPVPPGALMGYEEQAVIDRLYARLEHTDGPPPLHQLLLAQGITDLAPFSRTRQCTYSVARVDKDIQPKVRWRRPCE